jgi:hypothetical protein
MSDLVFVTYNFKLKERNMRRDAKAVLEFQYIESDDEWVTVKRRSSAFSRPKIGCTQRETCVAA